MIETHGLQAEAMRDGDYPSWDNLSFLIYTLCIIYNEKEYRKKRMRRVT